MKTAAAVIRTYNEQKYVGRLIETLRSQLYYGPDLQIVVVDSGSTDATCDIVRANNVKLITISKQQFSYSKALNLGIEKTSADFALILSAHAIPCSRDWLADMLNSFDDVRVVGVYCRQIPWPDADPIEKLRLESTFGRQSKIFENVNNLQQVAFSNVASCIRKKIWRQHKFQDLPAAEDRDWAQRVLRAGYKIIYNSDIAVNHSHNENTRRTAHRIIEIERAIDIRDNRKRNLPLTIKQSAGWFKRDTKKLFASKIDQIHKTKCVFDCAGRSFWFLYDFNRENLR